MSKKYVSVENQFQIDEDKLHLLAEKNDYWKKAEKFYLEVKKRPIGIMSELQIIWLENIETEVLTQ